MKKLYAVCLVSLLFLISSLHADFVSMSMAGDPYVFKGKMVPIPAGEFMMGTNKPVAAGPFGSGTAFPAHRVTLDAFEIGATEVTNEQYCEFLNAALKEGKIVVQEGNAGKGWFLTRVKESIPCWEVVGAEGERYAGWRYIMLSPIQGLGVSMAPEHVINRCWIIYNPHSGNFYVHRGFEDYPVTFVSWYGAYAFSEFYGLSLPTEAQWEYAARGGAYWDHELPYPTDDGTMDCSKANYGCKSYNHALPWPRNGSPGDPFEADYIGYPTPAVTEGNRYKPNPFGIYNMAGNVLEWCLDWYSSVFYQYSKVNNITHNPVNLEGEDPPAEIQEGTEIFDYTMDTRVMRSIGFGFPISATLSVSRLSTYPLRGNDHFGFRVVNNNPGSIPRYQKGERK